MALRWFWRTCNTRKTCGSIKKSFINFEEQKICNENEGLNKHEHLVHVYTDKLHILIEEDTVRMCFASTFQKSLKHNISVISHRIRLQLFSFSSYLMWIRVYNALLNVMVHMRNSWIWMWISVAPAANSISIFFISRLSWMYGICTNANTFEKWKMSMKSIQQQQWVSR